MNLNNFLHRVCLLLKRYESFDMVTEFFLVSVQFFLVYRGEEDQKLFVVFYPSAILKERDV